MNLKLENRVAVITGIAGGLGSAIAEELLEEGVRVFGLDKKINCSLSKAIEQFSVDLSSCEETSSIFLNIVDKGPIDILINNAGVFSSTPILELEEEKFEDLIKVNLGSYFFCSKYALPSMLQKGEGVIVNIASLGGQAGGIFAGADYSSSKAGVISLTKSLAKTYGPRGVRVNCVNPGPLETPMTQEWPTKVLEELKEGFIAGREKRLGHPREVSKIVAFLCSPVSSLIHGAEINANGGLYI